MKTFTVSFGGLLGTESPKGIKLGSGIVVVPGHSDSNPGCLNLGEYGRDVMLARVELSRKNPPTIMAGDKVYEASAFQIPGQKQWILTTVQTKATGSILVRVNTKTERTLDLVVTGMSEGSHLLDHGYGRSGPGRVPWGDVLVVIDPHEAVVVGLEDGTEKFVVVNNGGKADVVTPDEYQSCFVPHIRTTVTDTVPARAETAQVPVAC